MVKGLKSGLLMLSMLAAVTPALAQEGWSGRGGPRGNGGGGREGGGENRGWGGNPGGGNPMTGGQPAPAPAPPAPNRAWSGNTGNGGGNWDRNRGWQGQPPRAPVPGQPAFGGADRPWANGGYDRGNRPVAPRPDMGRPDMGRPDNGRPDFGRPGAPGFASPMPGRPGYGGPAYSRPAPDWNRGWQGGAPRLNGSQRWADQRRWNNDWRRDGRYDWQSYRYANRGAFRLPSYRPPMGWGYGYNRFSIGVYLDAPLFGDGYWIDDPYSYRLPPAYGTLRWVRYYDDALLVDVRDGYVVDVIHDFFW